MVPTHLTSTARCSEVVGFEAFTHFNFLKSLLEEPTLLTLRGASVLVEQAEGALLGLVALAGQVLERLLALHHLLATYNAAMLVLDQVGLGETAGGMLRASVKDLGLGANCRNSGHLILWNAILMV